jgi:hypothetical protein
MMKKAIFMILLTAMVLGAAQSFPEPPQSRTGIQFVVRLIEASNEPGAPNDAASTVPAELKDILKLSAYSQVGVTILRGREVEFTLGSLVGEIEAESIDRPGGQVIEFELELIQKIPSTDPDDDDEYEWKTIIETADIAKDGETVVLGASSIRGGGKAMIVLMTPTIIR